MIRWRRRLYVSALLALLVAGVIAVAFVVNNWHTITWNRAIMDPFPTIDALNKTAVANGGKFTFVVLGDSKGEPVFDTVVESSAKLQPDFFVHTGDFVDNGAKFGDHDWVKLSNTANGQFKRIPMLPVVGNHEVGGISDALGVWRVKTYFNLPEAYYTFAVGRYKFIVITWMLSQRVLDDKDTHDPEFKWLVAELAKNDGFERIVFCHRPVYTVGRTARFPEELLHLFDEHKVRIVFTGHDHIYYRTLRNQTYYVIVGMGGAPPQGLTRIPDALPGDMYAGLDPLKGKVIIRDSTLPEGVRVLNKIEMFIHVDVNGDRILCRTLDTELHEIDRFEVVCEPKTK
jgi:predicted phosphodiesterase